MMKHQLTFVLLAATCIVMSGQVHADAGSSSFTPTSFKIPIIRVSMSKADSSDEQLLYSCAAGTIADCMVDLADPTALAALTAQTTATPIKVGTYPVLSVYTCPVGMSGASTTVVKTTGHVDIGGTTYYTEAAGDHGISSSLSSAEETEIDTLGCTTITVYPKTPITVAADSSQTLSLTVDLTNLVYTTSSTSPGAGGCKAPLGGGARGICTNVPFLIPYLGTGTVTTERYLIANSSSNNASSLSVNDANGQVLLAIDPNGNPFYAGTLPYLSNTSPTSGDATQGGNGMGYGLSRVEMERPELGLMFTYDSTSDTVSFLVGGSLDLNGFGASDFQRLTHTGITAPRTGGTSWYYKAFKQ